MFALLLIPNALALGTRLRLVVEDVARRGPVDDIEVVVTICLAGLMVGFLLAGIWRAR
jgi:hypothetical protein